MKIGSPWTTLFSVNFIKGYLRISQSIKDIGLKYKYGALRVLPAVTTEGDNGNRFLFDWFIIKDMPIVFGGWIFGILFLFGSLYTVLSIFVIPFRNENESESETQSLRFSQVLPLNTKRGIMQISFASIIRFISIFFFHEQKIVERPINSEAIKSLVLCLFVITIIVIIVSIVIGITNHVMKTNSIIYRISNIKHMPFIIIVISVFSIIFFYYLGITEIANGTYINNTSICLLIAFIIYCISFAVVLSASKYIWSVYIHIVLRRKAKLYFKELNWKMRATFILNVIIIIALPVIIEFCIINFVGQASSNSFIIRSILSVRLIVACVYIIYILYLIYPYTKKGNKRELKQEAAENILCVRIPFFIVSIVFRLVMSPGFGLERIPGILWGMAGGFLVAFYHDRKEIKKRVISYPFVQKTVKKWTSIFSSFSISEKVLWFTIAIVFFGTFTYVVLFSGCVIYVVVSVASDLVQSFVGLHYPGPSSSSFNGVSNVTVIRNIFGMVLSLVQVRLGNIVITGPRILDGIIGLVSTGFDSLTGLGSRGADGILSLGSRGTETIASSSGSANRSGNNSSWNFNIFRDVVKKDAQALPPQQSTYLEMGSNKLY